MAALRGSERAGPAAQRRAHGLRNRHGLGDLGDLGAVADMGIPLLQDRARECLAQHHPA